MKDGLHGTKTLKETDMKKILALIVLSIVMVSCYEEYLLDYPITAIYFPFQQDVRTFVVGEGMKFEVGAALGGVRENNVDRNVAFKLDNSLITAAQLLSMQTASQAHVKVPTTGLTALQALPSGYYTLSNTSKMVIKTGWHGGTVVVKADSVALLADSLNTIVSSYVLPFYIEEADADTILDSKRHNVIGVKFENMLFGNYWHGGSARVERPGKADSTVNYFTKIPQLENQSWSLTTTGPTSLTVNAYGNRTSAAGAAHMRIVKKGTKIHLSSAADSPIIFSPDGDCVYNNPKLLQDRRIFLKYKYTDADGNTWHCTDTLRFRNRIRDGVNEWQDENPSHYGK
jgi:hypothetical protein